ncbi:MAG: hypothetical protein ACK4SJ_12335 [Sphingorhabdus sp.]
MSATSPNLWLIAAGAFSLLASLLHLACILGGPAWYNFFGAGDKMVRMAMQGSWIPAAITFAIAVVLAVWAAYAFSGAGLLPRLPMPGIVLVLISALLLFRATLFFVRETWRPDLSFNFMLWSSLIVLALGVCFTVGTWRAWPLLSAEGPK